MGAEESLLLDQRRIGAHRLIREQALLEALREIVEESQVPSEQLEHAWDPEDCSPVFRILSDKLTARRLPSPFTTDAIRGKKGYRQGRHVWEITWERSEWGSFAVIGIATPQAPLRCPGYLPLVGSNAASWGWNLSKQVAIHDRKEFAYPANYPSFVVPDTVYVILNLEDRTLSFATSDTDLGVAFGNLPRNPLIPLCPCASAVYGNCDIKMKYLGRGGELLAKLKPLKKNSASPPAPPLTVKFPPRSPTSSLSQGVPDSRATEPVKSSEAYKFHHTCGGNIAVMCAGKKAKRINAVQCYNKGVVLTSQPLQNDELFEVRLDSKVSRWLGSIQIGAITVSAENLLFPSVIATCSQGTAFVLSGNKILNNGQEMTPISKDLDNLSVGDRVGIMRKSDNTLHFFINGVNVGKRIKTIPPVLYGVVDLFGQAEEVTITGGTVETQSSNEDQVDNVSIMVRMNNTINILKEGSFTDVNPVVVKIAKDILEPYRKTDDQELQQKYGDHLAEIGGPVHLTNFLRRLMDIGLETQRGWLGISVVRSVLLSYSDGSLKMAKGLGRSGLLKILLHDLDTYGIKSSKNEKKKRLVSSALIILHNCAKASENRQILCELRAQERIAPFRNADDMENVVSAIFTLSYIISSGEQINLLEADTRVLSYILGMLRNALDQPDLRGRSERSTWSALEITVGVSNMLVNRQNLEAMLDRDIVALLVSLIDKGGVVEKECAANALWVIAKNPKGKAKIKDTAQAIKELSDLSTNSNQAVKEAAKRVLLELRDTSNIQGVSRAQQRTSCDYQENCRRFKSSLQLSDIFFDPKFDRCFCTECHGARGDKLYYSRGTPAKDYGIPIGWCRFGLKVHHRAQALGVFNKWHVAFHGTRVDSINPILECGDLLIPGDVVLGGRKLSEEAGHFNDERKPSGFDTKQIFVSPSVRYSGHDCYAKSKSFEDPKTKQKLSAKAVLQLCINPQSYQVGPQTIGATSEIDPKFSNQEIEWSTKERGSIIVYGLLVKLVEDN
ncbi:neuralized-like protein 4 [Montipora capricornis]|uniref:neuralized-like protein 4 n=1 Tax=Montipora capricornis TaxID=246305 RepID=UPI0035F128EA